VYHHITYFVFYLCKCVCADPSTLICSYVLQTNKSVKKLQLSDGFVLDKPDKWMILALQVRKLCC